MLYHDIIRDSKITNILAKINENGEVNNEKREFESAVYDLYCFQEKDNEFNRMTGKYNVTGAHYTSALLYYCAEKGWKEPVSLMLHMDVDLLTICLFDSYCNPTKIPEQIRQLFPKKTLTLWSEIEYKEYEK
jgi:hypothetical protein